jgi:hypothetical protein
VDVLFGFIVFDPCSEVQSEEARGTFLAAKRSQQKKREDGDFNYPPAPGFADFFALTLRARQFRGEKVHNFPAFEGP